MVLSYAINTGSDNFALESRARIQTKHFVERG